MTRAALALMVPWSLPFTVAIAFGAGVSLGVLVCVGQLTVY